MINIINVKVILLFSSIIGIFSAPFFFSGSFKKGAQNLGRAITTLAGGATIYTGGKEIYKDIKGALNNPATDNKSQSGSTGSNSSQSGTGKSGGSNKEGASKT